MQVLRMTKKRGFILLFIIILLITGYFIFTNDNGTENNEEPPAEEEITDKEKMDSEAELEDAAITLYSQDETTRWELKAESVEHFSNSQETKLYDITADVYQEGADVITLEAEEGTLDTRTSFLSLQGRVRIKSEAKLIQAEKLNWNSAQNELVGRGDILLKQQNLEIRGEKFISQINLNRLRVLENVILTSQKKDDNYEK